MKPPFNALLLSLLFILQLRKNEHTVVRRSEQGEITEKDIKLIFKTCRHALAAFPHNLNSIFKLLSRDAARESLAADSTFRAFIAAHFSPRLAFHQKIELDAKIRDIITG